MHMANITAVDGGLYRCEATNEIGVTKMNFKLDVLPPIKSNGSGDESTNGSNGDGSSLFFRNGTSIDCPIGNEKRESSIVWIKEFVNTAKILSNEEIWVKTIKIIT